MLNICPQINTQIYITVNPLIYITVNPQTINPSSDKFNVNKCTLHYTVFLFKTTMWFNQWSYKTPLGTNEDSMRRTHKETVLSCMLMNRLSCPACLLAPAHPATRPNFTGPSSPPHTVNRHTHLFPGPQRGPVTLSVCPSVCQSLAV